MLGWITHGFDLRWLPETGAPIGKYFVNHSTALDNADFVTAAIFELLEAGSVERVHDRPHIISPLGVVSKKGSDKFRLYGADAT